MCLLLVLTVLAQPAPASLPDSLSKAQKPLAIERVSLRREPDRWLAIDKFWHFSASFVTVGAAYHLSANRIKMPSPWPTSLALGGTLTVGVTKELCDLAGPGKHFSWKDLAADAAGVCVGYFAFIHRF
jgi:uncharacterized protein YfiM (DUF2279 family)